VRSAWRAVILAASVTWGTCLFAAPYEATVYTTDGQTIAGTLADRSFAIQTPYGTLNVPTEDITAVYPGFATTEGTRRRIAGLIDRLTTAKKDEAVHDLIDMGRVAVPQLQAAAASSDKKLADQAKVVLKTLWPTDAKVARDGSGILGTKRMELRGTLSFASIQLEGDYGRKTLQRGSIRLIQFGEGKVQPATDPPDYPPAKGGNNPDFQMEMKDVLLVGPLDAVNVLFTTDYGRLTIPVKDIISIKLGDPDEVVTRTQTLVGKLTTTTLELKSKVGTFKVDRDKVQLVKAVLTGEAAPVVPPPVNVEKWIDLFNGKDLTGWKEWGNGGRGVEKGAMRLVGDSGLTYENSADVQRVVIAAEVKINELGGAGTGIKLAVRDSTTGTYFVHFDGKNGGIFLWDNVAKQPILLKAFQADAPVGKPFHMQFAGLDSSLIVYINDDPVAEAKLDPAKALPAGKVSVGVWNCDAEFRDVKMKVVP